VTIAPAPSELRASASNAPFEASFASRAAKISGMDLDPNALRTNPLADSDTLFAQSQLSRPPAATASDTYSSSSPVVSFLTEAHADFTNAADGGTIDPGSSYLNPRTVEAANARSPVSALPPSNVDFAASIADFDVRASTGSVSWAHAGDAIEHAISTSADTVRILRCPVSSSRKYTMRAMDPAGENGREIRSV